MSEGKIELAELGHSPFLADVGPKDRSILRMILALLAGVFGAGVATMVILVVVTVVAMVALAGRGVSSQQMQELLPNMMAPGYTPTWGVALGILVFLAVANGMLFGGITFIAGLVQGRRFKAFFTAAAKIRWKMLLLGFVLFALFVGPVLVLDVLMSGKSPQAPLLTLTPDLTKRALYAGVGLICLIIAAGVEELLCRGWLLKQTAAWSRNVWVLLIVNGVLFAGMHLPDTDPNAFVGRMLMGMGFVYMTLRTSGIEFATGAHAANNWLLMMFVQTPPLGVPPPEKFQILAVLPTLLAILAYVLITEIVMRWTPLRNWGEAEVTPVGPPESEAFA